MVAHRDVIARVSRHLWVVLATVALTTISSVDAAKVLMIPMCVQSHVLGQTAMAVELSRRGHQVHMLLPSGLTKHSEGTSQVVVEEYVRPHLNTALDFEEVYDNITRMVLEKTGGVNDVLNYLKPISAVECQRLLEHNEPLLGKLNNLKFDIAVVDGLYMMKCLYLVPHRLGIPWITHTDMVEPWLVRVPWLPSFVPISMIPLTDSMTFTERLKNSLFVGMLAFVASIPSPPEELLDRYRRQYGNFRNLDELVERSVLWMTSRHVVSDYAKPAMPNMVDVGGLTVKQTSGKLPDDLNEFVVGAKKGVVLVTFGSMASLFPPHLTDKFVSAFDKLQQAGYRIIWRFNNKNNIKFAPNVWVSNWLPQNDLLAHPNVVLFITHGGNNGQMEAIYHAKPMIGFAINGDQPYNVRRMVHKGYGLQMDIHDFTADSLVKSCVEVMSNPAYKKRVTLASDIFKSDVQKPVEKAAWWIEHVVKFGSGHLRSAGNDLPWYQYMLIDVLLVELLCLVVALACVLALCRCVIRCCCCRSKSDAKIRQKKLK